MEERYNRLKQQQDELNAEREAFTEAAVKLGMEREQLLVSNRVENDIIIIIIIVIHL
jgi:hypothetical protein